jgi:hypothetical protein
MPTSPVSGEAERLAVNSGTRAAVSSAFQEESGTSSALLRTMDRLSHVDERDWFAPREFCTTVISDRVNPFAPREPRPQDFGTCTLAASIEEDP